MGCVLSYFQQGTLTPPQGQLTEKLLEGSVSDDGQAEQPADQKSDAAAATRLNGDSKPAEGDQLQDDASDEPPDDDKALLLGALGATAAGAVTVGAVAGALKTAEDRPEPQKTGQDPGEPQKPDRNQKEPETRLTSDQEETSETTQSQKVTPSTIESRTEPPGNVEDRVEFPGVAKSDTSLDTNEPPGDGGATTAAAAISGTGSVAAAALAGVALQSGDDTASAVATSDPSQRDDTEIEEEREGSAKSMGKGEPADLATEDRPDEEIRTPQPEEEWGDKTPISSPEQSEVLESGEATKSSAENDAVPFSESRDHTPLQSALAMSASPDDSVFDEKQPQAQPERFIERHSSHSEAPATDGDGSTPAEPKSDAVFDASGRESLSERLPEVPSPSPRSDKEDDPTHTSSPVVESPAQTSTEQGDSRVQSPEEESDKEAVTVEPSVEASSDQPKVEGQAKETSASLVVTDESLGQLEAVADSRVQSSAGEDDKEAPTTAAIGEPHVQSPTEWESLIHSEDAEEQYNVQTPASDGSCVTPSNRKEESSDHSKDVGDPDAKSSTDQESARPLTGEQPDIPSTITEEVSGITSTSVRDEDGLESPGAAKAETPTSAIEEKHDKPGATDQVSITASVDTSEQELVKEDYAREEVDTPKIVPAKRQMQQPSPEYEKFVSILVSPKNGKQASVEQVGADDSSKQTEDTEQSQVPSEIASDAKSEEPSGFLHYKQEDDVGSRAESSVDAVCGSATDLQAKIDSVQSPIPSVKEEPVVKVDRFSIDSEAILASAGSPKESDTGAVQSPGTIQGDTDVGDSQVDATSPPSAVEPSHDIVHKDLESYTDTVQVSGSGDVPSDAGSSGIVLKQDAPPDVAAGNGESTQDLPSGLELSGRADLNVSSASAEVAEESDMTHDISDRTEDYDFDPLAHTQSFVFPDDLAGRSSQLSEKPSSPFPDLDESDVRGSSATQSVSDVRKDFQGEAGMVTQEANVATPEKTVSPSESNTTAPGKETTSLKDKVKPEGASTTPAPDATSQADKTDGFRSEHAQPTEEAAPSVTEKGASETENETAEAALAIQQSESVDAKETAPVTPASPSQSEVADEPDASEEAPNDTEQLAPEVEQAATKIQAGVRGWQTRRKISRQQAAATQIQAGFRGWRVRHGRRMRRTSSLPDLSKTAPSASDDPYMDIDTLKDRAAAKIQAGFRGWRTRQEMKTLAAANPLEEVPQISPAISMTEVSAEEQAAARIQAGYRGWKTRRTLRRSLSDPNSEALVLAESQQQKRVAETGAGASGPEPAAVDNRLTSSVGAVTPRDEDETAHSIQSIQSEVAGSGDTSCQDGNVPTPTPSTAEATPAIRPGDEPSKTENSADSSTVEPSGGSPSVPSQADSSTAGSSTAQLFSADEGQQAEAAAKIQAGYRGWKTRQQMRADPADDDAETTAVRPTVSAKSVTDSGALPIDFAIVHRPEDDWLTQDLMKIEAEKRAEGKESASGPKTDEKLVASASDEPDGKEGKDARPDSASTTESSSSWLAHAQTEIRASFQGLRDNVSDALKTVEDTARLVREKGAAAGDGGGAVTVTENVRQVMESGAGAAQSTAKGPQGSASHTGDALSPGKPDGKISADVNDADASEKSPSEREEMEIWEEIQRSMRHED